MTDRLIRVLEGAFSIHRLNSRSEVPSSLTSASYCWIARTQDELSIICEDSIHVDAEQTDDGWSCLHVVGPLEFSEIGILSRIATPLANAGISVMAISTFDTDYFLVKTDRIKDAVRELQGSNWDVVWQG